MQAETVHVGAQGCPAVKGGDLTSFANDLAALLSAVRSPGDFHAAGSMTLHWPGLEVDGVGPVALPLLPVQAAQLIAVAERAPFGRGAETLVDTEVRRTWQIGPERVHIEGKHWARDLQAIVAQVANGLGVTAAVVPEFYKLLVYDKGCFFVSHRDSEKAPGMFATLLIALPSKHKGGELVVRHKGREVRLDLCAADPSEAAYAAFYADCSHEVLPVTAGCRLVLVYNLLRRGRGRLPEPADHRSAVTALADLLQRWSACKQIDNNDAPDKLVYPLEHAYTPAEISFLALKGADAGAAAVLAEAAGQAGCELHLALLAIEESGGAEHTGYAASRGWHRGRDEDEDEFEIGEIFERSLTLTHWQRPDGKPAAWSEAPFTDAEICPTGALQDIEFDEQSFQEATGNEGASFERTYQCAALVLWPQHRRLAVLCQAGTAATLPYLDDLVRRWGSDGAMPDSALWHEAHELAGHMLRVWPVPSPHYFRDDKRDDKRGDAGLMLALLTRLADAQRIDDFLATISAAGGHGKGDTPALLKAAQVLPALRAGELLASIVAANAPARPGLCADLLHRAARATALAGHLQGAARSLLAALPGEPAHATADVHSWRRPALEPELVFDLLNALWRIDLALSERAVDQLLARPESFGLDALIVPALRRLIEQPELRKVASGQRLLAAALSHLRARAALDLQPPGDWTRAVALGCPCTRCAALARFLASPDEQAWTYKANESERSHVEATVQSSACDVDCSTDRRGRPFSLVCTKNQASYERRATQRQRDLADLALLGGR